MSNPYRSKPVPAADVAVVAQSSSVASAARRLGVHRSTIHRWVMRGEAPRPGRRRRAAAAAAGTARTPAGWKRWLLRTYELDATERLLVDAAVQALTVARDPATPPVVQLAGLARFAAIVRQLDFDEAVSDATENDAGLQAPRRRA